MADVTRIVVCDDDAHRVQDWADRVAVRAPGATVDPLPPVEFAAAVRDLKARMTSAKSGRSPGGGDAATTLDAADVLILDSDLTPDRGSSPGEDPQELVATHLASELGAEVAHLARAYSTAGAIVVVNQGAKTSTFDLTLSRFQTGIADVYVTDDDLDNAGLWDPMADVPYRPWAWPDLLRLPARVRAAANSCQLTDAVLATIGLDGSWVANNLLTRQIESIDLDDAAAVETITFRDIATSSGFGLGLRPKEITSQTHQAQVAVCGTRHWLERVVLPAQNILVDLPHLLQRQPWLVKDRDDLQAWNQAVATSWSGPAIVELEAYNAKASEFLGRSVWNVGDLTARAPGQRAQSTDPVFCEDTSRFSPLDAAVDFLSDIEGSQARRFIAKISGVTYTPPTRMMQ